MPSYIRIRKSVYNRILSLFMALSFVMTSTLPGYSYENLVRLQYHGYDKLSRELELTPHLTAVLTAIGKILLREGGPITENTIRSLTAALPENSQNSIMQMLLPDAQVLLIHGSLFHPRGLLACRF